MNTTAQKISVLFGLLAAGTPQLVHAFPPVAMPWIAGAASVFALVALVAGAYSDKMLGKKVDDATK